MVAENYEVQDPETKATLKAIGAKIGSALRDGWSFMLMIFELGGPDAANFYISSAERADMIRVMSEWIARQSETQASASTIEINPNHPVTKAAHENWHKVLAVVLHKFRDVVGRDIVITPDDIASLESSYIDMPSVVLDEQADGLHLRLVAYAEAEQLARKARGLPA